MAVSDKITGIVLAGGKSSRMGTDKSLMLFKGKTLIEKAIDVLQPLCEKVVISSNKDIYQFTGCECWPDEMPSIAPIVGIFTCLIRSETSTNIILSCDMPFVNSVLLSWMLSQSKNQDIILPRHHQKFIEPLCGIYNQSALPAIEEMIGKEDYSLQNLITYDKTLVLDIDSSYGFYNENTFTNINTMQDYNNISLA